MSVTIERVGFAPNYVNYVECLDEQYRIHDEVANRTRQNTILLLEHEAVITAGKRTEDHEYPADKSTPVVKIDRGGKLTWHGPGQLTGYPILRLPEPIDVVAYVRIIEEIIINVLAGLGIKGERVEGRSGVWIWATASPRTRRSRHWACAFPVTPPCTALRLTAATTPHPSSSSFPAALAMRVLPLFRSSWAAPSPPADILEPLEAELLKYQDRLAESFEPIAAQD